MHEARRRLVPGPEPQACASQSYYIRETFILLCKVPKSVDDCIHAWTKEVDLASGLAHTISYASKAPPTIGQEAACQCHLRHADYLESLKATLGSIQLTAPSATLVSLPGSPRSVKRPGLT